MYKHLLSLLFLIGFYAQGWAVGPQDISLRSMVDTSLAPFYHGVASGDPTPNAIVIWTRVTGDDAGPVSGTWRMALDTNFTSVVQSGTFTADSTTDYCVKIDVTGLQSNTWYFYEFTALGRNSLTGRTKTAPTGGVDQLRFAFVSCSNYPTGYFNAYDRIKDRNDVDAVLHLGDYIYEYAAGITAIRRDHLPTTEIIKLSDYRQRYSSYRLDPSLRKLHQQYPFITVWDDHETANNSWMDGAENHTPGNEGPWINRKNAGQQAYEEWLPIRLPEAGNPNKIWRKMSYGNMADIFMLDTRLYGRTLQGARSVTDTAAHLLGREQMEWLKTSLKNSTAKWKILGQQVMVGNLNPFWQIIPGGLVLNDDQWDGYQAERKELYDFVLQNDIKNMIVLTGDIHTAWAMDLPYNQSTYNKATGQGSVGVEFVCTSVTSSSSPVPLDPLNGIVYEALPHIKYVELHRKGYGILNLETLQAQADYYNVNTIERRDTGQRFATGFYTVDNTRWLKKATTFTSLLIPKYYQAPENPRIGTVTGIRNQTNELILLSAYPNPFIDQVLLQFNIVKGSNMEVRVYDLTGREMKKINLGFLSKGLHNESVNLSELASGAYKLVISSENDFMERTIEKF
jgi:alkaline phosphatase D